MADELKARNLAQWVLMGDNTRKPFPDFHPLKELEDRIVQAILIDRKKQKDKP